MYTETLLRLLLYIGGLLEHWLLMLGRALSVLLLYHLESLLECLDDVVRALLLIHEFLIENLVN